MLISFLFVPVLSWSQPDWMSGASAAYPKAAYLTGVGEGATQEKAADKARAEVAKGFGVSLTAISRTAAAETSAGDASSSWQEVSDEVKTSTQKVLDGVEVVSYWQGPQGWYAFAVLDREHNLKVFKDKLAETDRGWKEVSEELARTEGKFARLKIALRLLRLAKDRRRVNQDFRILNPEGQGIPAPDSYEQVLSKARKAVAVVTVAVEVAGAQGRQLTSRIMDGLSATGLKVVEKGGAKTPDIMVEASAEGEPLRPENLLWYWAKGSIMVKLSYGSTGEVFTRFEESGQDAARDPRSAMDATLRSLAAKTAAHVFSAIISAELVDE